MTLNNLEFKGKLIFPKDIQFQEADFLREKFGRVIDEQVRKKYKDLPAVTQPKYNKTTKLIEGSSILYTIAVNEQIRPLSLRTATPKDLANILNSNVDLELKGQYVDSAIVIRSKDNPNKEIAKYLAEQIKSIQKLKYPSMISLPNLNLKKDKKVPQGVLLELIENPEIIHAPQLAHKNNQKTFSKTDENGLPIFDKNGSRTLYTIDSGVSELAVGGGLGWDSGYDNGDGSGSGGRVVVVSTEGASQKILNNYVTKLQQEKERQIAQINEKYTKAENILKGKA